MEIAKEFELLPLVQKCYYQFPKFQTMKMISADAEAVKSSARSKVNLIQFKKILNYDTDECNM